MLGGTTRCSSLYYPYIDLTMIFDRDGNDCHFYFEGQSNTFILDPNNPQEPPHNSNNGGDNLFQQHGSVNPQEGVLAAS